MPCPGTLNAPLVEFGGNSSTASSGRGWDGGIWPPGIEPLMDWRIYGRENSSIRIYMIAAIWNIFRLNMTYKCPAMAWLLISSSLTSLSASSPNSMLKEGSLPSFRPSCWDYTLSPPKFGYRVNKANLQKMNESWALFSRMFAPSFTMVMKSPSKMDLYFAFNSEIFGVLQCYGHGLPGTVEWK